MKNIYRKKSLSGALNTISIYNDLTYEQRGELKKLITESKTKEAACREGFLYRVRGTPGRWKIVKFLKKKEEV